MPNVERLSISIDERYATEIRKLVETGAFRTISAAFEEAATILIEQEVEKVAWWAETVRRCDQATTHPDLMIGTDAFFEAVRSDIAASTEKSRSREK